MSREEEQTKHERLMESPVIKNVRYWLLLGRCSRDGPVEMSYFEGLFDLLTGLGINHIHFGGIFAAGFHFKGKSNIFTIKFVWFNKEQFVSDNFLYYLLDSDFFRCISNTLYAINNKNTT